MPWSLTAFRNSLRRAGVMAEGDMSPRVAYTWMPLAPRAWALSRAVFTSVRKESSMTPMEKGYIAIKLLSETYSKVISLCCSAES